MHIAGRGTNCGLILIAFDTVDYCILLEKLEMCGFDQHTLKWFKSYFEGRRQFTSINGYKSDEREVTCGVPQGSLLGPLLFTLFVNDMPNNVQFCELALYADDTCLFTSSTDLGEIERKLNEDILSILSVSNWLKDNKLMVNPKKCEVMFIGTHQHLKIKHNRIENCHVILSMVMKLKRSTLVNIYIGVEIDRNLSWNSQIEHVKKNNKQKYLSS